MSTQTSFDVTGLSRAIRRRDCRYHLALYAADAEVEIFDRAQPGTPLRVLRGRPAIGDWLQGMSSAAVHYDVRDAVVQRDRVSYTEECRYGDGSSVAFDCDAEVRRGQIVHAAVTLARVPPHEAVPPAAQRTAPRAPERPARRSLRPPTPSRPEMSRDLPGNFLG
ncbi:hypothetical protein [Friedmanniella luteola]|nr:hypothetical protein [Friedmanniella luteola]